jgi:hypothetical protein
MLSSDMHFLTHAKFCVQVHLLKSRDDIGEERPELEGSSAEDHA